MPKIAKKCVSEKMKSHFVSQCSLICDFEKLPISKIRVFFLGIFILGFFRVFKIWSFTLNYGKIRVFLGYFRVNYPNFTEKIRVEISVF